MDRQLLRFEVYIVRFIFSKALLVLKYDYILVFQICTYKFYLTKRVFDLGDLLIMPSKYLANFLDEIRDSLLCKIFGGK